MSATDVTEHYQRIAERYTDYLSYSGDFVPTLAEKMIDMLRLTPDDTLVDIGGGSGIFAAAIIDQIKLDSPPTIVDPFAEMLEIIPEDLPVQKLCMDGLDFAGEPRSYDKVLIKETIHHIPERDQLMRRLHDRITPGGALLLVHVPPELDYPLFDAALERARNWHADPDQLEEQMADAGFSVERDSVDWKHRLPKERYRQMVESQYMSVLSSFDDDELAAGLAEMDDKHAGVEVLEFVDHFDYIAGYKTDDPGGAAASN
jgi:ubiquinone/menaquinone biosynthesis C-methylase UbiE